MSAELATLQQTYRALERALGRVKELESNRRAAVSIVGIGCRFPGGIEGPRAFRAALLAGTDTIERAPHATWRARLAEAGPASAETFAQPAGFLTAVYDFDAAFFGISPREAELMDPQQRHVLEIGYRALEDAGIAPDAVRGRRVGIFLGAAANEYHRQCFAYAQDKDLGYVATGNAQNAIAGRLAHVLGTHGPTLVVDTACSSALVAVHLAVAALRSGECELALAGGVNLMLDPLASAPLVRANMLSPSGACRAFDAGADGYVRAEGCGVVVLMPAEAARRGGHRVYADIAGSALNHDGTASSLTAPSGQAQQQVIRAALDDAAVAPREVQYVEAHGTGTPLGDPIELQALAAVYVAGVERPPLRIGTAKTNLGHTEAASGIAGLIKTALCIAGGELLPSIHFARWNPQTQVDTAHFELVTAPTRWDTEPGTPRTAAVSSFGFTGTNAHVVLRAAQPAPAPAPEPATNGDVFCLSAKNGRAFAAQAAALAQRLEREAPDLRDLCLTSQLGRSAFALRTAWLVRDVAELRAHLHAASSADEPARAPRLAPATGFAFADTRGAEVGAAELAALETAFPPLARRMAELRHAAGERAVPAAFLFSLALAQTLIAAGVEPAYVAGEGDGAVAAAFVAGLIDLTGALDALARGGRSFAVGDGRPRCPLVASLAGLDLRYAVHLGIAPRLEALGSSEERASEDHAIIARAADEPGTLAERCLRLFAAGWTAFAQLDWRQVRDGVRFARVGLAEHPFAHQHYQVGHERRVPAPDGLTGTVQVDAATAAIVAEHEVLDTPVVPGAFWLALIAQRARGALALSSVCFHEALPLGPGTPFPQLTIAAEASPTGLERERLEIASSSLHFSAVRDLGARVPLGSPQRSLHWALTADAHGDDPAALYALIRRSAGIAHGPNFRLITRLVEQSSTSFAELTVPAGADLAAQPLAGATVLLDACLQVLGLAAIRQRERRTATAVAAIPFAIDALALAPLPAQRRFRCIARLRGGEEAAAAGVAIGDIELETETGETVAIARGVSFKEVSLDFAAGLRGAAPSAPATRHELAPPGPLALYDLVLEPLASSAGANAHAPRALDAPTAIVAGADSGAELAAALARHGVRSVRAEADLSALPGAAHVVVVLDRAAPDAIAGGSEYDAYADRIAGLADVVRALRTSGAGTRRCTVVLRGGLAPAAAGLETDPLQAAAAAFFASAAWDLPGWSFRFVDVRAETLTAPAAVDALLAEAPSHVVLTGGGVMVPRLRRLPSEPNPAAAFAVRVDRTYLISGGHGSLGRAAAEWLARAGAGRIVLLGRTAPSGAALAAVERLRALGATVDCEALDVADADAVSALVERIDRSAAPLAGVIHAAGVLADRPAHELGASDVAQVSRAKVRGTPALLAATRASRLEFFVAFSSLSALIGNAGQAAYAAANAYMDALVARARGNGVRAYSAQWGPWTGSAMVDAIPAGKRDALRALGIGLLAPDESFAALEAQLAADAPACMIARIDWNRLAPALGERDSRMPHPAVPEPPESAVATAAAAHVEAAAQLRALAPEDRPAALLAVLRAELATALALDADAHIPADQGLFELGLDSLAALDLREALERALQIEVPPTALFNYPTLDLFAAFLLDRIAPPALAVPGASAGGSTPSAVARPNDELEGELRLLAEVLGRE